jgi:hypothetical protein
MFNFNIPLFTSDILWRDKPLSTVYNKPETPVYILQFSTRVLRHIDLAALLVYDDCFYTAAGNWNLQLQTIMPQQNLEIYLCLLNTPPILCHISTSCLLPQEQRRRDPREEGGDSSLAPNHRLVVFAFVVGSREKIR